MKSKHSDYFNHDDEAASYDKNVKNEDDPIRAGYDNLLNWMAAEINERPNASILELGSGTGNLTSLLNNYKKITCVDISTKMMEISKEKIGETDKIIYKKSDILEFFDSNAESFDLIISSYAIHHLTDEEKNVLFQKCWDSLNSKGAAIFGDLMFESSETKTLILDEYKASGNKELVSEINEEFFWDISTAVSSLKRIGFEGSLCRFSALSFAITALKDSDA